MSHVLHWRSHELTDGIRAVEDVRYDVITRLHELEPFLTSVASASDAWLFLGSHGGVTAGRRNPDHALFPYCTEDKLRDSAPTTGEVCLIRAEGQPLWSPSAPDPSTPRWMAKSVIGDEVVWGVDHPALGLEFRVSWRLSPRFGVVRACRLANHSEREQTVTVLDGLRNLLPAGVAQRTQNELSVLLDAYKRSEIDPATGLGVYSLSSQLTDLAEPSESLSATTVWRLGPPATAMAASARGIEAFRRGHPLVAEHDARGVRSAHVSSWTTALAPGASVEWVVVADTDLDTAGVHDLNALLADPDALATALAEDLAAARDSLAGLLAQADAFQATGDAAACAHHTSSVLFNAMRGGVPLHGHVVTREGLDAHLRTHNRRVWQRLQPALAALPESFPLDDLRAWADSTGDPDAQRLARTYLALSFSRRHGDPSRPWNRFDIVLSDVEGRPATGFQGNWRDVFQNWEALALSYPELTESMVCLFVNATTADGYNPYRITHEGIDWEVPEPENPWSNIGYWGDHQIVYLLRLLELSERTHPGRLRALADRDLFAAADVPYRIAPFDRLVADPGASIAFDAAADVRARDRAAALGGDGLLRHDAAGAIERTTLADKLLTLVAAKLVNLVPDTGIWMNTQRPEWNDANNALAGLGVSVVTTAYLARFVEHLAGFLDGLPVRVRPGLGVLLREITDVLAGLDAQGPGLDRRQRWAALERLGRAGERYREGVYDGDPGPLEAVDAGDLARFLTAAAAWLRRTVSAARRPDGLYHSYFMLGLSDGAVDVHELPLMLEGQVAVLASGLVAADEAAALAERLRTSALYRPDQHSYLLYPDRDLPGFLARNAVDPAAVSGCPDAAAALADPRRSLLVRDRTGGVHFAAGLRNARVLEERAAEAAARGVDVDPRGCLRDLYEATFHHRMFTGRSGSFFAYEGLGSIYWHMVSKLGLALLEAERDARVRGVDGDTVARLAARHRDVRAGLGFTKTAYQFGAFPNEAYSHTPRHAGAQQPGMTGQVKEDIVARLAELGVTIEGGLVGLDPGVVADDDWLRAPATLPAVASDGSWMAVEVPAGHAGFTLCGVPVLYRRGGALIEVSLADGSTRVSRGTLDADISRELLARTGAVRAVRVR